MIFVSGSVAMDHLMTFPGRFADHLLPDHLAHVSLSFLVDELTVRPGGVGANICYAMGEVGLPSMLLGAVGSDFGGHAAELAARGVDLSGLLVLDGVHTARFTCTTDTDMAQLASMFPGAMARASTVSVAELASSHGTPELVVIGANDPAAMLRHTAECRRLGIPFAADPSQQLAFLDGAAIRELIDGAAYLFGNEYEWQLLRDKTGLSAAAVDAMVGVRVTTLGAAGVLVVDASGAAVTVPAVPEHARRDPTGVGDAFRAGFLAVRSRGGDLTSAARLGCAVAVVVLESVGPQGWSWDRDSGYRRLSAAYGARAAEEIARILAGDERKVLS